MSSPAAVEAQVQLDLSDVAPRVGELVGGGQLWDPCSSSDIRRWVMAMDYPDPLHWDEEFARAVERNQIAIISEAIRAGASLFTSDRPIGDRQSSPIVNRE